MILKRKTKGTGMPMSFLPTKKPDPSSLPHKPKKQTLSFWTKVSSAQARLSLRSTSKSNVRSRKKEKPRIYAIKRLQPVSKDLSLPFSHLPPLFSHQEPKNLILIPANRSRITSLASTKLSHPSTMATSTPTTRTDYQIHPKSEDQA